MENFYSFNVVQRVDYAPRYAEIMRTTWVVTEKSDNLSKSGSTVKARLCTMEISSTEGGCIFIRTPPL